MRRIPKNKKRDLCFCLIDIVYRSRLWMNIRNDRDIINLRNQIENPVQIRRIQQVQVKISIALIVILAFHLSVQIPNRLDDLIDNLTSEADDASTALSSRYSNKSFNNLIDPDSPPINDNHRPIYPLPSTDPSSFRNRKPSKNKKKLNRFAKDGDYSSPSREKESDIMHRRKSLGDERRHQLTDCIEFYGACLESAQQFHPIGLNQNSATNDQRKQYTTALWSVI